MVDLAAAGPTATGTIKATTTAGFAADVVAASQRQPVLVLFQSPRSDQCRIMRDTLARLVDQAEGKLALVTLDIDAQPQIPSRLGIRSVPAVYVFDRGQPIDGFAGALPDAQVKNFLERLIGPLGDAGAELLAEADAALAAGDVDTAAAIYSDLYDQDPNNFAAAAGLMRVLVGAGDLAGARALYEQLPPAAARDATVAASLAALENAEQADNLGDLAELVAAVERAPDDHQARFDLALALNGKGRREEAADMLLTSIKLDRTWNDGAARKQLLSFFEAWGLMDSVTLAARRKLSTLLFS